MFSSSSSNSSSSSSNSSSSSSSRWACPWELCKQDLMLPADLQMYIYDRNVLIATVDMEIFIVI